MRYIHAIILMATVAFFAACGDDDPAINPFLGNWTGQAGCISDPIVVVIAQGSDDDKAIVDFDDVLLNGTVDGNIITIPEQEVTDQGEMFVTSGSLTLSGTDLTISLTITDEDQMTIVCTGVLTK